MKGGHRGRGPGPQTWAPTPGGAWILQRPGKESRGQESWKREGQMTRGGPPPTRQGERPGKEEPGIAEGFGGEVTSLPRRWGGQDSLRA